MIKHLPTKKAVPSKKVPVKRAPIGAKVQFVNPHQKLFVGSYHRIPVRLTGVTFDQVQFVVPDGAKAGIVSPSQDATFIPQRPHILLCVGYEPGTYVIEARNPASSAVLGQMKFTSDTLWLDSDAGPSRWFTGITQGYSAGAAWGAALADRKISMLFRRPERGALRSYSWIPVPSATPRTSRHCKVSATVGWMHWSTA